MNRATLQGQTCKRVGNITLGWRWKEQILCSLQSNTHVLHAGRCLYVIPRLTVRAAADVAATEILNELDIVPHDIETRGCAYNVLRGMGFERTDDLMQCVPQNPQPPQEPFKVPALVESPLLSCGFSSFKWGPNGRPVNSCPTPTQNTHLAPPPSPVALQCLARA